MILLEKRKTQDQRLFSGIKLEALTKSGDQLLLDKVFGEFNLVMLTDKLFPFTITPLTMVIKSKSAITTVLPYGKLKVMFLSEQH